MYGKLFSSMYDGTLYGNWKALVTFQQMIILCNRDGVIDMTPQAIAARTSIPLEIIKDGIDALEKPDEYSRSPDLDGRRIERLDDRRPWGWRIVNHAKYRALVAEEEKRQADRERIASKRAAEAARLPGQGSAELSTSANESATCRDASQVVASVANVAHAEAEADKNSRPQKRTEVPTFHQLVIDAYHELLPNLPQVRKWTKQRRKLLDSRIAEKLAEGKPADTIVYWHGFLEKVGASDWLCGRKGKWRASLPWLLGHKGDRDNFLEVIEGNYDNPRSNGGHSYG
jgi:hypothetical protein